MGKRCFLLALLFVCAAVPGFARTNEIVEWTHGIGMYDINDSIEDDFDWTRDSVLPWDGMAIPQLYQYNYGDPVAMVGGRARSPKTSGCGATSLSMVAAYITGNTLQTPHSVFRFACLNGLYHGDGLSHDAMDFLADHLNLQGTWIGKDAGAVLEALAEGKPVIAHMGYGIFTKHGHYIVLRGIDAEGKVLVNDPNSFDNTHTAFDIKTILSQTRTSTPFLILTRKRSEK